MKTSLSVRFISFLIACSGVGFSYAMEDGKGLNPPPKKAKISVEDLIAASATNPPLSPNDNGAQEPREKKQKTETLEVVDVQEVKPIVFPKGYETYESCITNYGCLNKLFPADVLRRIFSFVEFRYFYSIPDVCHNWRWAAEGYFILPSLNGMKDFMEKGITTEGFTRKLLDIVGRDRLGLSKLRVFWESYFDLPLNERLFRSIVFDTCITLSQNPSFGTDIKAPFRNPKLLQENSSVWAPYALALAVYSRFSAYEINIKLLDDLFFGITNKTDRLREIFFPHYTASTLEKKAPWVWNPEICDECPILSKDFPRDPAFLTLASSALVSLHKTNTPRYNARRYSELLSSVRRRLKTVTSKDQLLDLVQHPVVISCLEEEPSDLSEIGDLLRIEKGIEMRGDNVIAEHFIRAGNAARLAVRCNFVDQTKNAEFFSLAYHHYEKAIQMMGNSATAVLLLEAENAALKVDEYSKNQAQKTEYVAHAYFYNLEMQKRGNRAIEELLTEAERFVTLAKGLPKKETSEKRDYYRLAFQYYDKAVQLNPTKKIVNAAVKAAKGAAKEAKSNKDEYEKKVLEYQAKLNGSPFPG